MVKPHALTAPVAHSRIFGVGFNFLAGSSFVARGVSPGHGYNGHWDRCLICSGVRKIGAWAVLSGFSHYLFSHSSSRSLKSFYLFAIVLTSELICFSTSKSLEEKAKRIFGCCGRAF